jgi:hypothetical protein
MHLKLTKHNAGQVIEARTDFIVYKRVRNGIAQLLIPKGTKIVVPTKYREYTARSFRKLRAEKAIVLCIVPRYYVGMRQKYQTILDPSESFDSRHDLRFKYIMGKTVKPRKKFSKDITDACKSGIHFFESLKDAENY